MDTTSTYLSITSPLDGGEPKFELLQIEGEEGVCKNFFYQLRVYCKDRLTSGDLKKLIGEKVTASIGGMKDKAAEERYVNGVIYKVTEVGLSRVPLDPDFWYYDIEISSWLTQLKYVKDCRIFQKEGNDNIKIVEEYLGDLGMTDFDNKASGSFAKKPYLVMYDETAYNFVIRLLQEEGVMWFFKHDKGSHKMVFMNDSTKHPESIGGVADYDFIQSWCLESCHVPVKTTGTASFDWEKSPVKTTKKDAVAEGATLADFRYPGLFIEKADGDSRAERVATAFKSQKQYYTGRSGVRGLAAGHKFKLSAPMLSDVDKKEFVTLRVKIEADKERYTNEFVVTSATEPFLVMPEEGVKKPLIPSAQTALVVGKKNDYNSAPDKHGRVKVKFHWDYYSKSSDEKTLSADIRVSMPGAGNKKGFIFNPNFGEEVIVAFEDGNPDRPLIIGTVYSPDNIPPTSTPASKPYDSIIKSHADAKANQIMFTDKKGKELLFINAKKDYDLKVLNNQTITVTKNREMTIKKDVTNLIKGKQKSTIKKDDTVKIDGKETITVKKKYKLTVKDNYAAKVKKNYTLKVDKAIKVTAKGDITIKGKSITLKSTQNDIKLDSAADIKMKAGKNVKMKAGMNVDMKAGMNMKVKAGMNLKIKAGMNLDMNGGMNVKMKAGMNLKMKGGLNAIMEGGLNAKVKGGLGAEIKGGLNVKVKGGLDAKMEGGLTAMCKGGLKGTVKGGVLGVVKGAIVQIN